jgi:hypothetical protein
MVSMGKKQLKDEDVQRCTCGAWYYIGFACGFCNKEQGK